MNLKRLRAMLLMTIAASVAVSALAVATGYYSWNPEKSKSGPVTVLVSIPEQTAYVYRNGVQIGTSSVSTGKPGHETPTGTFTVLEKDADHKSSTYKGAPMPYMERLTWSGIALHAGQLPGYPASHGCVRLPLEFAKDLYQVTSKGTTVIITDKKVESREREVVGGHLPSHVGFASADESRGSKVKDATHHWKIDPSIKDAHFSILVSYPDEKMYVFQDGNVIGHTPVHIQNRKQPLATGTFVMLDGYTGESSIFAPGKAAHRWMVAHGDGAGKQVSLGPVGWNVAMPTEFAKAVYNLLKPGAVLVLSNESATEKTRSLLGFRIFHH